MITFIRIGIMDDMGFQWFNAYEDETPILLQGVHLSYLAKNEDQAKRMYDQDIELELLFR